MLDVILSDACTESRRAALHSHSSRPERIEQMLRRTSVRMNTSALFAAGMAEWRGAAGAGNVCAGAVAGADARAGGTTGCVCRAHATHAAHVRGRPSPEDAIHEPATRRRSARHAAAAPATHEPRTTAATVWCARKSERPATRRWTQTPERSAAVRPAGRGSTSGKCAHRSRAAGASLCAHIPASMRS